MRYASQERGSALITVVVLTTVILTTTLGVLYYAGTERERAVANGRATNRIGCAEAGLQLARTYYGSAANAAAWNQQFLPAASAAIYNPMDPTTPAIPTYADGGATPLQTSHPELFADLDGDGKYDVYLYIHDNADELPPAPNNPYLDNDQAVVVGAMCISTTLAPRLPNGQIDPDQLVAEALLMHNLASNNYSGQAAGGSGANGNLNGT